jgi:hypothetical protein
MTNHLTTPTSSRATRWRVSLQRRLRLDRGRPGQDSLDIRALVSPFRYDVIVRSQFFRFLRTHAGEPLPALLQAARAEPYFAWFTHVECARFFPRLLEDPDGLNDRFDHRVQRALNTMASFDAVGFDLRRPVTLVSTSGQQVTDSGAPVSQPLHIADGCHRLALLLTAGKDLEPEMYRVHPARGPILDNTRILLQHLEVTDDEYVRFLSYRFAPLPQSDLSALRVAAEAESPGRLAELEGVLAAHGRGTPSVPDRRPG